MLNLGMGGACVSVAEGMTPGERVSISFSAPSLWDPLALPARVAWAFAEEGAAVHAGLAFEPTDASSVFALFELVTSLVF